MRAGSAGSCTFVGSAFVGGEVDGPGIGAMAAGVGTGLGGPSEVSEQGGVWSGSTGAFGLVGSRGVFMLLFPFVFGLSFGAVNGNVVLFLKDFHHPLGVAVALLVKVPQQLRIQDQARATSALRHLPRLGNDLPHGIAAQP